MKRLKQLESNSSKSYRGWTPLKVIGFILDYCTIKFVAKTNDLSRLGCQRQSSTPSPAAGPAASLQGFEGQWHPSQGMLARFQQVRQRLCKGLRSQDLLDQ